MKYAIPVTGGKLSAHFGHCEQFALIDTDQQNKSIIKKELVSAPAHQPGLLPKWLAEKGVNIVIAGGMGANAQNLFQQSGIKVLIGAPSDEPEKIVHSYLGGNLVTGENICDH